MTTTGWIWVLGIWVLFFWLYRDYRLDLFRYRLFVLRDELFDLASAGRIEFDGAAYGMTRDLINGSIRFGHRLGFLDVLCLLMFGRGDGLQNREIERYAGNWELAIAELDPNVRKSVESIRSRLHYRIFEQIIFTSAVLMFSLITLLCWMLLTWLRKTVLKTMERLFSGPKIRRLLDVYDCSAAMR